MFTIHRKFAPALGLDIRDEGIHALQLCRQAKRLTIKNYFSIDLPAAAITGGKILQKDSVSAALTQAVARHHLRGYPAAIALSATCVISQQIALPGGLSAAAYARAIQLNHENYFATVPEALAYDYWSLPSTSPTQADFMLVAARARHLQTYVDVVQAAGLSVKYVDVDQFALLRALPWLIKAWRPQDKVGILHLSVGHADFIVCAAQQILWQQHVSSLRPETSALMEQLEQAVALYLSAPHALELDYLVLSGAAAAAQPYFQLPANRKITLKTADVLTNLPVLATLEQSGLGAVAPQLTISCGLALRDYQPC